MRGKSVVEIWLMVKRKESGRKVQPLSPWLSHSLFLIYNLYNPHSICLIQLKETIQLPHLWAELWAVGSRLYTAVNAFTQSNYPAFPASSCWSSTALMSYGTTVPCCITGGWSHKYKRHITWSSFFFFCQPLSTNHWYSFVKRCSSLLFSFLSTFAICFYLCSEH